MRKHGAKGNKYLTEVLSEAATFDEFVDGLFDSLLRFDCQTSIFGQVYDQRKKILKGITGYNPLLANYLKKLTDKKDIVIDYFNDLLFLKLGQIR